MEVVFYISGHGFGHATRDIEVLNAIGTRLPEARLIVRTTAAAWLLNLTARTAIDDIFVDEMPRVLRCRHLPQEDLLAGRWTTAVEALLGQPPPPERPQIDGAEVAASAILNRVV